MHRVGEDVIDLVDAAHDGGLDRRTAADLVRAGRGHLLVGLPEGPWLDVKSEHYDLSTDRGTISLAQGVTRFCNGEQGGIVVVGMRSKRVPGGEVIHSLCPLPPESGIVRRYETAIDRRVHPPPDGMCVEAVTVPGGMLILIDIPPQPEELKPFLVHGAIIGDHVEGAFISIVRRRGEGSIPVTAPMIHSALAAGRALLRRGELPDAYKPETFESGSRPR